LSRGAALLLACLTLGAWPAQGQTVAPDDPALAVVEACRARLDPALDIGVERVARRCPELLPALERAPWHALLPLAMRERREDLSAAGLAALAELVREARSPRVQREAPDRGELEPILLGLELKPEDGPSRWERLKKWLRERFEKNKEGEESGWLDELLLQIRTSEGFARALTWLGYGLVIGLAGYVIWGELRAAGVFGGRSGDVAAARDAAWRRRLSLRDLGSVPLADRPGLLLKLLGEALARARRLPAPEGLTASGIATRAELESEAERASLARVALCADRVRYAGDAPDESELTAAVESARELLHRVAPPRGRG
jgi:hypothetical protein